PFGIDDSPEREVEILARTDALDLERSHEAPPSMRARFKSAPGLSTSVMPESGFMMPPRTSSTGKSLGGRGFKRAFSRHTSRSKLTTADPLPDRSTARGCPSPPFSVLEPRPAVPVDGLASDRAPSGVQAGSRPK